MLRFDWVTKIEEYGYLCIDVGSHYVSLGVICSFSVYLAHNQGF